MNSRLISTVLCGISPYNFRMKLLIPSKAIPFVFGVIYFSIAVSTTQGASFDCGQAQTIEEKTICSDAKLSAIDELMGKTFSKLLEQTNDKQANLSDQRLWIKTRHATCQSLAGQATAFEKCLRVQTSKRLLQLTNRLTFGITTASKPQIGRCRMDSCSWHHIVDKRVLGQKNGHDLIEVEYIYGMSPHPPGSYYAHPNYPSEYSLEFETDWAAESGRAYFYCNPQKPVVILDEAILLHLNGPASVHEYIAGVWTHACYLVPSGSYWSEQWREANGIADIDRDQTLSESEEKQFLDWVKSFDNPSFEGICTLVRGPEDFRDENCRVDFSGETIKTYHLNSGATYRVETNANKKPKINGYWTEETNDSKFGKCYPILEEGVSLCFRTKAFPSVE
ncbi:MAG: DUF1311 domain-containing protein [Hyphomicrobiales bacterium]|nr:DUF1311 domain-containing protein [Hyphomicrobiales bacterium]